MKWHDRVAESIARQTASLETGLQERRSIVICVKRRKGDCEEMGGFSGFLPKSYPLIFCREDSRRSRANSRTLYYVTSNIVKNLTMLTTWHLVAAGAAMGGQKRLAHIEYKGHSHYTRVGDVLDRLTFRLDIQLQNVVASHFATSLTVLRKFDENRTSDY